MGSLEADLTQISPPSALGELLLASWLFCCCLGAFVFCFVLFPDKVYT